MSTSIVTLLAELAQLGIRLRAADGRIACSPAGALKDDLRQRIVLAKAELLALLSADSPPNFAGSPLAGTDRTAKSPAAATSVSSGSASRGATSSSVRPNAVCLSCFGTRFVRLRNGRRSVCFGCEQPAPGQVVGEDEGAIGGAQ